MDKAQCCPSYLKFFAAMSDPTRQRIAMLLHIKPCCVGELTKHFTVSQPTISRHLGLMENAGILHRERRGQQVFYALNRSDLVECCLSFASKFGDAEEVI